MKTKMSKTDMCENCGDRYWCSGMCREMYEILPDKRLRKRKRKKNARRNYEIEEYVDEREECI